MITVREQRATAIYLVVDRDGQPTYVGKSLEPRRRWYVHRSTRPNAAAYFVLQWVSSKNFCDYERAWILYFRSLGFPLENKNSGGGGAEYFTEEQKQKVAEALAKPKVKEKLLRRKRGGWSDERKKIQSQLMKGRKPWNTGLTKDNHSGLAKMAAEKKLHAALPEQIEKFSRQGKTNKGKKKSPQHAAKMKEMNTGAKRSDIARLRMQLSQLGKKQPPEQIVKRLITRAKNQCLKSICP